MKGKKYTQTLQVIDTLRQVGGYSTLGNLYHLVDTSAWATKTPNESIRRIVQQSPAIFAHSGSVPLCAFATNIYRNEV